MSTEDDQPVEIKKQSFGLTLPKQTLQSYYDDVVSAMMRHEVNTLKNVLEYGEGWNRKSHVDRIPKSAEFRIAQQQFWENLQRQIAFGERQGYIDNGEEGPEMTSAIEYKTVYDETEEEWEARKDTLPATVTFPIVTRRNES